MTKGLTHFIWLSGIPKKEVASVKDSTTSGLPAQGHGEGVAASGSGGRPAIPDLGLAKDFVAEEDVAKIAFVQKKNTKKKKL